MIPNFVRRFRLQRLMARQLTNWREVWAADSTSTSVASLRFRDGTVLHAGADDAAGFLFLEIFANGCYRAGLPAALDGDIVDVGANIGAFTLDVARRYPGSTVHAYEPDATSCARLRENVAANGLASRVRVWNEAVSASEGTMILRSGSGSVLASAYAKPDQDEVLREVPAVTLTTVMARASGRVGLLKLDCEGAEADIVDAAPSAAACAEYIVAEYHEELVPGVLARLERALAPRFEVRAERTSRCGPLLRARRRPS